MCRMGLSLLLTLLIIGLSLLAIGCGGLEAPPVPTVTRIPTATPVAEVEVQRPTPTVPPPTPTSDLLAGSGEAVTVTPFPQPSATMTPLPTSPPPAVPTGTHTLMSTPTSILPQAVVREGPLNVRTGPGTLYPRIGQLAEGTAVEITGRDEEGSWWQITYETGRDEQAWVSANFIQASGDITPEVVEAPPVPPTLTSAFTGKIVFQERSGGRIFIINANGTGLRELTYGLDPALSPDGTKVAFTRWGNPEGIYLINVDGTQERLLTNVKQPKCPEWSRDGTKIAFTHRSGGGWRYFWDSEKQVLVKHEDPYWKIGVADAVTGQFFDLSTDEYSFTPSWSTDGWWLLYDGQKGLMLTDPIRESKRWQQVTYGVRDMSPDWAPRPVRSGEVGDDPWAAPIAYMVFHNDHWEIHTILPSGQGDTRLTPSPMFEAPQNSVAPNWSPDGKWIAFLTDRRGKWEIWIIQPDGSRQQPLFSPGILEGIEFHYEAQSEQVLDWGL